MWHGTALCSHAAPQMGCRAEGLADRLRSASDELLASDVQGRHKQCTRHQQRQRGREPRRGAEPFAQLFGNEPYHFHFVRIQVPVDRRDPISRVASGSPVAGGYAFAQRHKPKRSERK